MSYSDFLVDDDAEPATAEAGAPPWRILVVDDDEQVHGVTTLALGNFVLEGRRLELIHAYTGAESVQVMSENPDIAVILMDVVMEDDAAGLTAVRRIREELRNDFVRIILRTGQPGQAPEQDVITQYDINDYKEKTELTSAKLFSTIYTALSSFAGLMALDRRRQSLEQVIEAATALLRARTVQNFSSSMLEQLSLLAGFGHAVPQAGHSGFAVERRREDNASQIIAGMGIYARATGQPMNKALPHSLITRMAPSIKAQESVTAEDHLIRYFRTEAGREIMFYIELPQALSEDDSHIIELFCRGVAPAFDNLARDEEMTKLWLDKLGSVA